jgi:Amt family ammonium transporter
MTSDEPFDAAARIAALEESFDNFWPAFAGFSVLLMQLGFAFLEAGCVRFKNMQSIMIKVFMNTCIGIICWWACGYAIAFGNYENFIGRSHFAGSGFRYSHHLSHWSIFIIYIYNIYNKVF